MREPRFAARLALIVLGLLVAVAGVRLAESLPPPSIGVGAPRLPAARRRFLASRLRAAVRMRPVAHPAAEERWFDIAGAAYSADFKRGFSYARARVKVTYLRLAAGFCGWIRAEGLKPNFAYQLKLRGDYARDPLVHRAIGYLGRWRLLDRPGTNFDDRDYENCPDKSRVESYIIFDFIVTDARGRACKSFYANSSLHVLWNDALNGAWINRDTPSRSFAVVRLPYAYSAPPGRVAPVVDIWAESQHSWHRSRPRVGELRLPRGRYRCDVVLTEESFHQSAVPGGGYWATVLAAPVDFVVER